MKKKTTVLHTPRRETRANEAYNDASRFEDAANGSADSTEMVGWRVCEQLALLRATILELDL